VRDRQNLVAWLAFHAQRERDIVRLAMAFKLQKPRWGSHATLVAFGLASYLEHIDWDLPKAEARFQDWHDTATASHDKAMLMLRAAQIKELADLVLRPRVVTVQATASDEDRAPAALLLPRLINRGLLFSDVRILAGEGPQSPLSERMLPDLSTDDGLRRLYRTRHSELRFVTANDYVDAIEDDARGEHPDVLRRTVLEHVGILARLGSVETPLVVDEIVRVAVANGDGRGRDADDAPTFAGGALDA
jgi:hypothetical protein